jgi:HSP20 family protein
MSSRWEPLDNLTSLRDAMNRLFDQSVVFGGRGESGGPAAGAAAQTVPVNIFEAEDVLMITMPMPGVQDEDIEISARGNTLTVESRERADLKPDSGKRYLRHEWRYGPYRRMVELPYAIDANSAEATFGNGVLTVRLQKAETERVRRINVRGASGSEGAHEGIRSGSGGATQGGTISQQMSKEEQRAERSGMTP